MDPETEEPDYSHPQPRTTSKSADAARREAVERMQELTARERILLALDLGHRLKRGKRER